MAYKPIESYGVIGDLHTVALVGMDGSIETGGCGGLDARTAYRAALREKTRERVHDQGRRNDPHRFAGSRGAAFGNQALMLALRTAGEPARHQCGPLSFAETGSAIKC
jgi:hypothetical protein